MNLDVSKLKQEFPIIGALQRKEEAVWLNPGLTTAAEALGELSLTMADIDDAEARLLRFAPFLMERFPETAPQGGLIESPLREIGKMQAVVEQAAGAPLGGRLWLKMDSHLAVAGSIKARGGIYEILKYAEELAERHGKIAPGESYRAFAQPSMEKFFSEYSVHVGSTGNLGLSIGIISAALGFRVTVHMSTDAKQWKKDLLRQRGVTVLEYSSDYSAAVKRGRAIAEQDPMSYFVDDEDSASLFLGYAVAAKRLRVQLAQEGITVDAEHPLAVYLPCGVGGAPGGVTFGLKELFGDNVYCFFIEPTEAPCMLLGMATGLHSDISVQDIGLSGRTDADGLAVGRPSKFVGKTVGKLLGGVCTIRDNQLYRFMGGLMDSEDIFIEPSACAAFQGPAMFAAHPEMRRFIREQGLTEKLPNICHIAWATGGSLVPPQVREAYYKKAKEL